MKIVKKILNAPVQLFIAIIVGMIIMYAAKVQSELTFNLAIAILAFSILASLYMYYGTLVAKNTIGFILIIYIVSIYSTLVSSHNSMIAQPFFMSLASIFIFLSVTYNENHYNYNLRSRSLWTVVLAVLLFTVKMTMITLNISFWYAEATGLLITAIYSYAWTHWVKTAKKTKITEPIILNVKDESLIRRIAINNTLDMDTLTWTRGSFYTPENAYPYIYSEALKAYNDGKLIVIESKLVTSNLYSIGEIVNHKASKIPYLYIEVKNGENAEEMIDRFIGEVDISI